MLKKIKNSIKKKLKLQKSCIVVGLPYYDYKESNINKKTLFEVMPEKGNTYDKTAMVVYTDSKFKKYKIGYIRKQDNQYIRPGLYFITRIYKSSIHIERMGATK